MKLAVNPIVRSEARRRFRGAGATWGLLASSVAPGLAAVIAYRWFASPTEWLERDSGGAASFWVIVAVIAFVLTLLVPAVVGGSIAQDRSRGTLPYLQLTQLRPREILFGKLAASLMYLGVSMVTLLPTLTVPYLIGGLDGWTVLAATAVLVAYVAELTAISAAVSSAAKGPVSAIVVSIVVIVGMTILPELFLLLIGRPGSFPNSVIGTIAPQSVALWLPGLLLDEIWAEPGASLVFSTMWWFIVVLGALAFAVRRLKTPR